MRAWALAGVVLAAPGLVGCTSGPTLSELGAQLQQDGTQALDEAAKSEAAAGVEPTITDDASKDVSCGDGKAKRVLAGSFPFSTNRDLDTTFDLAWVAVLGRIDRDRYKLTKEPDSADLARREFVLTGQDDVKMTLTFTFSGGASPVLALRGETACLKS